MRILLLLVIIAAAVALFYFKPWEKTGPVAPQPTDGPIVDSPYVSEADRFLTIAGTTIRVRDEGPKDAPVLVLLHGFTFSLESWDEWAQRLAGEFRVIRYDLLGHGLSGPDPQQRYGVMERVAYLDEVLNALNLTEVSLGGNSLGGLVAWRYASQHPNRIKQLVLVSPAAFSINGVTETPAPVPPAMGFFLQNVTDMGMRTSLAFVFADKTKITEDRVALGFAMMAHPGNGEAFVQHLEEFTLPDPTEDLTRLKTPTLIMWGVQDALIPSVQGSMMVDAMPNAELKSYALAGHIAHEELPDETARDAKAFLTGTY